MDPTSVLRGFENYWKNWNVAENWRLRHLEACASVEKSFDDLENTILSCQEGSNCSFVNDVGDKFNRNNVQYQIFSGDDDELIDCPVNFEEHEVVDNNDSDLELEFVVSEEMIDFFEQSMRHKIELQKQRQMNNDTGGTDINVILEIDEDKSGKNKKGSSKNAHISAPVPNVSNDEEQRTKEMALLYGDAAPKICGMEIAIQLSYNRLCDRYKPIHWPCIPFKP